MTKKRFENRLNKDIKKFHALNPVWDNKLETAWNVFEMIDLLNKYDKEYNICHNDVLRLEKENEQLKQQLKIYKNDGLETLEDLEKAYENNKKALNNIEQLQKENKELKEKIQLLQIELNADAKQYKIFIDIIDEADDLICSHLSKHYQRKWRFFCKNKEYDFE